MTTRFELERVKIMIEFRLTLTTTMFVAYCWDNFSKNGLMTLHGPHQVAKKSITTILSPALLTCSSKSAWKWCQQFMMLVEIIKTSLNSCESLLFKIKTWWSGIASLFHHNSRIRVKSSEEKGQSRDTANIAATDCDTAKMSHYKDLFTKHSGIVVVAVVAVAIFLWTLILRRNEFAKQLKNYVYFYIRCV